MRHFAILIFLIALLGSKSMTYGQDAMSVWDTSGVKVDGQIKEWPSFFRFYISGAKFQFDFYNDSTNLYLCIKAVDLEAQNRLMHSGVDIWFDPTGKKKHKIGITFPLKLEGAPGDLPRRQRTSDPSGEPSEKSRASKLREHVLFAQASMKVTGMIDVKEPEIPLQNKYGIDIAYDWDSLNILAIEYKIPLSLIYQHHILPSDLNNPMGLGIVVGAMETAQQQHVNSQSQQGGNGGQRGGMQSGMGGGGGGRGGGGRGGGSSQNNLANDRFSTDSGEQKVWLKVHWETKAPSTF